MRMALWENKSVIIHRPFNLPKLFNTESLPFNLVRILFRQFRASFSNIQKSKSGESDNAK